MGKVAPWKVANPYIYVASVMLSVPLGSFAGITLFAWLGGGLGAMLSTWALIAGLIIGYCLSVWLIAFAAAVLANIIALLLSRHTKTAEQLHLNPSGLILLLGTPLIGAMFWFVMSVVQDSAGIARIRRDTRQWMQNYQGAAGDPDKTLILQFESTMEHYVAEQDKDRAKGVSAAVRQWLDSEQQKDMAFFRKKMYLRTILEKVTHDNHITSEELNLL